MRPPPEVFSLSVVLCPSCQHGIDPHGVEPGDYCGVGTLTEDDSGEGGLVNVACKCLWSPNDIAAWLLKDQNKDLSEWKPKMLREKLVAARAPDALTHEAIRRLVEILDLHRPIGPDGKHGDLHTPTCGCEDQ